MFREESEADAVARVLRDCIAVTPYDPAWPAAFAAEEAHLREVLPAGLIGRIEHIGSTAVPGLCAKPVVDLLVEVTDVEAARLALPAALPPPQYDYFWRPESGDEGPRYSFLIRRDVEGRRTHHLHCVPAGHSLWICLRFRDLLRTRPDLAIAYGALKRDLAARHADDRVTYTQSKTDFITRALALG